MREPLFQYQQTAKPVLTDAGTPAFDPTTQTPVSAYNPSFLFRRRPNTHQHYTKNLEPIAQAPTYNPETERFASYTPDFLFQKKGVRPEYFSANIDPIQNPWIVWESYKPDQYLRPANRQWQQTHYTLSNLEPVRPASILYEGIGTQPTVLPRLRSRHAPQGTQTVKPFPETLFVDKWLGNQPSRTNRRPSNINQHTGTSLPDFATVFDYLDCHATIPNPLPAPKATPATQEAVFQPEYPAIRLDWFFQQPDQPARTAPSLSSPERVTEPPRVVNPLTDYLYVQPPAHATRRAPAPVNIGVHVLDPGELLHTLDFTALPTDYIPSRHLPTAQTVGASVLDPGSIYKHLDWNTPQPDPVRPPVSLTPSLTEFVPPPALYIYDPSPLGWYSQPNQPYLRRFHHAHLDPAFFHAVNYALVTPVDPTTQITEVSIHFTTPTNKLDFTIQLDTGCLDFTAPANKLDFTLDFE